MHGQDEWEGKVLGQSQGHDNENPCESQVYLKVRVRFGVKFSVRVNVRVVVRDIMRNRVDLDVHENEYQGLVLVKFKLGLYLKSGSTSM